MEIEFALQIRMKPLYKRMTRNKNTWERRSHGTNGEKNMQQAYDNCSQWRQIVITNLANKKARRKGRKTQIPCNRKTNITSVWRNY